MHHIKADLFEIFLYYFVDYRRVKNLYTHTIIVKKSDAVNLEIFFLDPMTSY